MVVLMTNVRGVISCLSTLIEKEKCDILIITDHKLKKVHTIILILFRMNMLVLLNLTMKI